MRMAGRPSQSSQSLSLKVGSTPEQISWTMKLGMAASTCRVAMPPIGPSHAWGAMKHPEASAIAPTFQRAVMPPTWLTSHCRMSTVPSSRSCCVE